MQRIVTYLILAGFMLLSTKPFQKIDYSLTKSQSTSLFKYIPVQKNVTIGGGEENLVLEEDVNEEGKEDALSNHFISTPDYCFFQLVSLFSASGVQLKRALFNNPQKQSVDLYSIRMLRI